jgi:hypothetical protein
LRATVEAAGTIAKNAIADAYFAVAKVIVQCNITLAF